MTKAEIRQSINIITKEKVPALYKLMKDKPLFILSLMKQIKRDEIIEALTNGRFETVAKSALDFGVSRRTIERILKMLRKK